MKEEETLHIMEHIDSDIIEEASSYQGSSKRNIWFKWGTMAACLCLLAVGVWGAGNLFNIPKDDPPGTTLDVISSTPPDSDPHEPAIAAPGLYIPPVDLPDPTAEVAVNTDMIGLVVYSGGIYTQSVNYFGAEAQNIDNLTGKYLGHATGSIDEWSTQEEYTEEFASSVEGDVYEVLGYDTDFRICIRREFVDENGDNQLFIESFDRLNGITLATGADLFESRLRISNRIAAIQWQSHNDWNYNLGNLQAAVFDNDLWEKFLEQIKQGTFVNTWDPDKSGNTIYDTEKQAHMILTMEDGTEIPLRLIEGGYVGYDALGWYFVQIPGEIFDAVFTACGGSL